MPKCSPPAPVTLIVPWLSSAAKLQVHGGGVREGHRTDVGERVAVGAETSAAPLEHPGGKIQRGPARADVEAAAAEIHRPGARAGVGAGVIHAAAAGQVERRSLGHRERAAAARPAAGVLQSARRDVDSPAVDERDAAQVGDAHASGFSSVPSLLKVPDQPASPVLASALKSNVAPA